MFPLDLFSIQLYLLCVSYWFGESYVSGAAGEATSVFGESASECIQKQYMSHDVGPPGDDHNLVSGRQLAESVSPRQLRLLHGNNVKDNSLNHNAAVFAGNAAATQPNNGVHANISFYNTPSPMATQVLYLTYLFNFFYFFFLFSTYFFHLFSWITLILWVIQCERTWKKLRFYSLFSHDFYIK